MMRSIWRVVRNPDLAEDSLQDALAVVWKKRFQSCSKRILSTSLGTS